MPRLRPMLLAAIAAAAASSAGCATMDMASTATASPSHWGYEGASGPAHWADLDEANAACAGSQQSPIDLTRAIPADVGEIAPTWSVFRSTVANDGHTIEASASPRNITRLDGDDYQLLQVHWHHESEHTIDGRHASLEAHFVHRNAEAGALLVLGVMFVPGAANPELQKIWDVAPSSPGEAETDELVNFHALLPADRGGFRYYGSLTTPPCSEIVQWMVFRQPVTASPEQIARFAQWFPHNNRPVQPRGRRFLLVDR